MSNFINIRGVIGVNPNSEFAKENNFVNTDGPSLRKSIEENIASNGKIDIHLHTPGGMVHEGLNMINQMKSLEADGANIRVINAGLSASMGAFFLLSTSRSATFQAATVMFHDPRFQSFLEEFDSDKLRERKEQLDVGAEVFSQIMTNKNDKPEEFNRAILSRTTWLTARQSVANNFVDEVIDGEVDEKKFEEDKLPVELFKNIPLNYKQSYFKECEQNNSCKTDKDFIDCNTNNEINQLLWKRILKN